ncbi:MAG: V-type ATP synthase subunit I [Christensenellales bacterium]
MAVLPMNKICICAIKKDRKDLLEFLQRQGCVEVKDGAKEDNIFTKTDTSGTRSTLKKGFEAAVSCGEILDRYCNIKRPMTAFLHGRKSISVQESNDFYNQKNQVLSAANHIIHLENTITAAKEELVRLDDFEKALEPWLNLPVPQTFQGTKKTVVFIGSVASEYTKEKLGERLIEATPELDAFHIEIIYTSKEQTCFYMIALNKDAALAEEALRSVGFSAPSHASNRVPRRHKEHIEKQRQQNLQLISKAEQEIIAHMHIREDLRFFEDHLRMREEKYSVIERLMHSRHAFILQGYIAEKDSQRLIDEITKRFDCAVEIEPAINDENAPVKIENKRFFEPAESTLESYSLPGEGEIDPTPVMSVFYYIMFGLMFSDAGYGLIMAGVCGALLMMHKNMPKNWKKNIRLFFWCGVSTVFWGIIFSSYFGDVLNVVSKNFFGREIGIPPVWFAPLDSPMKLLVFCLGIGIVHLVTGYIMKAITYAKNKQYIDIIYDVVYPVAILFGLVTVLMSSDMFYSMAGFKLYLSKTAESVCLGVAVFCIVGVLLTGGRESKSWFKRILKGIYELYNVLAGWLGDILSYSRLLALGLATGVIASVINSLGTMTGSGIMGFLAFIVIFIIGHALNFGINVLGAYVHSNRLEFVEFFGKFYEGGGRKFLPYSMNTKYYLIEEEDTDV